MRTWLRTELVLAALDMAILRRRHSALGYLAPAEFEARHRAAETTSSSNIEPTSAERAPERSARRTAAVEVEYTFVTEEASDSSLELSTKLG